MIFNSLIRWYLLRSILCYLYLLLKITPMLMNVTEISGAKSEEKFFTSRHRYNANIET